MKQLAFWLAVLLVAAGGLVIAWAFIRFGLLSTRRLRGTRKDLRRPEIETISKLKGKTPLDEIVSFYENAPWLESLDIALAESGAEGARVWEIGEFIPPTHAAVTEWQAILGLPDLPLATDLDKGYYFLSVEGPVLFRPPGNRAPTELVAPSVSDFSRFVVAPLQGAEENGAA